ncbi:unnamed protein product, partial [Rhizoctonia solani]
PDIIGGFSNNPPKIAGLSAPLGSTVYGYNEFVCTGYSLIVPSNLQSKDLIITTGGMYYNEKLETGQDIWVDRTMDLST